MKKYKIAIDTKGCDRGAKTIIKGASIALNENPQLEVLLVGDRAEIESECALLNMDMSRVEILDAPDIITNYDNPSVAIFAKPNSSLVKALSEASCREDIVGVLNAGSTGALLAGSMRFLSGKNRVRPALAAVLPSENGGFTCLVDTGATIDCSPEMLHHFAKIGTDFMKKMYAIENPRVGLLSNGAEETKGNMVVKEAHQLLKNDPELNFVGNLEGSNALSGKCDILVCDGFAGNQVLKVTEGTARRIITDIVKYAKQTGKMELMEIVQYLMATYDIASLGGGIVLGIEKPVIKAHGACDEKAIVSTTKMLLNMAQNKEVFDRR